MKNNLSATVLLITGEEIALNNVGLNQQQQNKIYFAVLQILTWHHFNSFHYMLTTVAERCMQKFTVGKILR